MAGDYRRNVPDQRYSGAPAPGGRPGGAYRGAPPGGEYRRSPSYRPAPPAQYRVPPPPPGGYWPQPPRPRPRRSAGALVAGVLGGIAAIFVFAIIALSMTQESTQEGSPGSGRPAKAANRQAATDNKLYKTGKLTPVNCRLPAIQQGSNASMNEFLGTLTNCLDQAWQQQFGKANLDFAKPGRVFWSAPGGSPCGSYPAAGASAFYCPENNTMYIGLSHVIETAGDEPVSNFAVYARVVAHEYGHHVQSESGILAYGHRAMRSPDIEVKNENSRRIELQAQCMAGVFIGSESRTLPMTNQQYETMIIDVRGRGDDRQPPDKRDHGSNRNYAGWVARGYQQRVLSTCNTWNDGADVS